MMKTRIAMRMVVLALVLSDHEGEESNSFLYGVGGSWICEGRRGWSADSLGRLGSMEDTRSFSDGFSGGARKAMAKGLSPMGDDGVTMMAGKAAFSSTSGSERSNERGNHSL